MPTPDLAERFINAFNAIDQHLREEVRMKRHEGGFVSVLYEYEQNRRNWAPGRELRAFAGLRNVLTHERYQPQGYLAIPTEEVVRKIERIRDGLLHPRRVTPDYSRNVFHLTGGAKISEALTAVRERDYSQFPVYNGEPGNGSFLGLLTENGLTRWLSAHVTAEATIVDLEDHSVQEALAIEEKRTNVEFIQRDLTVDEVQHSFSARPFLEACLITHRGRDTEKLLGIVTRWDILDALA